MLERSSTESHIQGCFLEARPLPATLTTQLPRPATDGRRALTGTHGNLKSE